MTAGDELEQLLRALYAERLRPMPADPVRLPRRDLLAEVLGARERRAAS